MDEPSNIGREDFVIDNPGGEFVPFIETAAIDGDAPFDHLVFAGFKVGDDLFGELGQVATLDHVVGLEEDSSESRFSHRIIFEIEFVEAMK